MRRRRAGHDAAGTGYPRPTGTAVVYRLASFSRGRWAGHAERAVPRQLRELHAIAARPARLMTSPDERSGLGPRHHQPGRPLGRRGCAGSELLGSGPLRANHFHPPATADYSAPAGCPRRRARRRRRSWSAHSPRRGERPEGSRDRDHELRKLTAARSGGFVAARHQNRGRAWRGRPARTWQLAARAWVGDGGGQGEHEPLPADPLAPW